VVEERLSVAVPVHTKDAAEKIDAGCGLRAALAG
jgi:hypothetical protein